jgi:hypothetical protein
VKRGYSYRYKKRPGHLGTPSLGDNPSSRARVLSRDSYVPDCKSGFDDFRHYGAAR